MASGIRRGPGIKDRSISPSAGIRPYKLDLVYATEAAYLAAKSASGENSSSAEEGDFFYDSTVNALKVHNGTQWEICANTSETIGIAFNDCRVHDNLAALLPVAAANDDMGNVPGTVGTTAPSLQGVDFGGTSTDEKCTFSLVLPPSYVAGQTLTLRAHAGMLTTVSDGTATLDVECWVPDYTNNDGTVSSDLCTTAAQSINSTTLADKDFTIDDDASGHVLGAGDVLQFRLSFAGSDTGDAGVMIPIIRKLDLIIGA